MSDDMLISIYTDAKQEYDPYKEHSALCRINYRWAAADNYDSLMDVWMFINKYKTHQHESISELAKLIKTEQELSDHFNLSSHLVIDPKEQNEYVNCNSKEVLIDLKTKRVDVTPLMYHADIDEIIKKPTPLYNLGKQWMTFDEFDKTYRKIRIKMNQGNNLFIGQDGVNYLI